MQMYCCSVWTIQTRSLRISYTIPKMSTTSYFRIPCRIRSKAMKVPLLPTPALQWSADQLRSRSKFSKTKVHSSHLQWTTIGRCSGLTRSLNARTNLLVKLVLMVMIVITVLMFMIVIMKKRWTTMGHDGP